MGHAKAIVTVDTYIDIQANIEDCETEIQKFIREVHPYDFTDAELLTEMFQEEIEFQEEMTAAKKDTGQAMRYDYSDIEEMENIDEGYFGKGQ